jgi:superfamily II DNA/RNA helicase
MDQSSRIAEPHRFKAGTINSLVAADVAAPGLDITGVSHIFNFDTPWHPDDYVHRIGRTGRAGATGRAFTLVTDEDAEAIGNVEKLTGGAIPLFAPEQGVVAEPAQRAERPRREERRREDRPREDRPREDRPRQARQREERRPRTERAVAEPHVAKPHVAEPRKKADRAPRPDTRPAVAPKSAPTQGDEGWCGPVPGFLNVGFGLP